MMEQIKSLKVFFLAALFVMGLSGVAFAGAQDFVLVNNTGYPIYVVNVSPARSDDWHNDILGGQVLGNGQFVEVKFPTNGVQYWDIAATFEDGSGLAWYNIDLLTVARVTLNSDGSASLQ